MLNRLSLIQILTLCTYMYISAQATTQVQSSNSVKGSIIINTNASIIWDALTNPDKIILYTGLKAKTDWQTGSPVIWEGEMNGIKYQNKGQVLKNDKNKQLEFTFWTGMGGDPDLPENYSIVTYELKVINGTTTEFTYSRVKIPTETEKHVFEQNLQLMLQKIKKVSEEQRQQTQSQNGAGMKIALVSVLVNDPIEAFKFYTEKLGFIEKMYQPEMYIAVVASPEDPDGTSILLEPNNNLGAKEFQEGIYKAGLPVIIFSVEDIYKEYERLKNLGVKFIKEPTKTDWGIEAIFDDTCGNYIQLLQR